MIALSPAVNVTSRPPVVVVLSVAVTSVLLITAKCRLPSGNSISNADDGSVVIATSKEAFYHDEDQDTDFGSPGPVHTAIKVYQLSASVGRGFAGDAVI